MTLSSLQGATPFYTALGPTSQPGGYSGMATGQPGMTGFGFPSFGDPLFYFAPAGSSFLVNRLLGFANGSAVNINFGPVPSTLGLPPLLLGNPFFGGSGNPGGPFGAGGPFANGALGTLGDTIQQASASQPQFTGGYPLAPGAQPQVFSNSPTGPLFDNVVNTAPPGPSPTGNPIFPYTIGAGPSSTSTLLGGPNGQGGIFGGGGAGFPGAASPISSIPGAGGGFDTTGLGGLQGLGGAGLTGLGNTSFAQAPQPQQKQNGFQSFFLLILVLLLLKKKKSSQNQNAA